MSRPKEHDERTAAALLDAAERLAAEDGSTGLSVRRVATEIGTTTRAVYSVFGSKEGLMVALGARAFDLLGAMMAALPRTSDPRADLVQGGVVFRRFTREHPVLFQIAIQRVDVSAEVVRGFEGPRLNALADLQDRIARLRESGQLGRRSVQVAVWEYHAVCEGLAALEARCFMRDEDAVPLWQDALASVVRGWACEEASLEHADGFAPD
jgi:AcrR family transcriptional regulator